MESSSSAVVRFLIIWISACAPAFLNALAESTSQFVPGNAGITTLGFANLTAGPSEFLSVKNGCSTGVISLEFLNSDVLTGKMPSTGSSHLAVISSRLSASPFMLSMPPSAVFPRTAYTAPSSRLSISSSEDISSTSEPYIGDRISPSTFTSTPVLFPAAIFTSVI